MVIICRHHGYRFSKDRNGEKNSRGIAVDVCSVVHRSHSKIPKEMLNKRCLRIGRISMPRKLMGCPGWLELSEDRTSFVYVPERAAIVRKIFELSIAGLGGYTIAKWLNSKKVPPFGPSTKWDQSTIHNLLSNRATIGENLPGKHRKRVVVKIDPVPYYYPAVIEESLFEAAQEARRQNLLSGRGRKGRFITNLFAGLPTCSYCHSPVKFHSNGAAKSLICSTVLERSGCCRMGWTYQNFENSFFDSLEANQGNAKLKEGLVRLSIGLQEQSEGEIYDARLEIAQILRAEVSELVISSGGDNPPVREKNAHIQRDYPGRYFTVCFSDGSSWTGYPSILKSVENQKVDCLAVSKFLSLSPRQGELTALLAEGVPLSRAAQSLSMTLATARWHLREVFRRTNTHSQIELAKLALKVCNRRDS
jgi:DNA-binding CsgD family transcriptional regulator